MSAMCLIDLEAVMENSRFRDELLFQTSMNMAKTMLESGTITEREYKEIQRKFTEKYNPPLGTLLSEIKLT